MLQKLILVLTCVIFYACSSLETEAEEKTKLDHQYRFTTFNVDDYSAIKLYCDVGRVKVRIRQYEHPKVEIHKTYQKYVRFEPSGDTLMIHIENTPKNSKEDVKKYINFFLPNLRYLESEVGQIVLENFIERKMFILNHSNSLRLLNCKIQDLTIENEGINNIQLDSDNYFDDLYVGLNTKSYYNSDAMVLKNFTIKVPNLDHATFQNIPPQGFKWLKR